MPTRKEESPVKWSWNRSKPKSLPEEIEGQGAVVVVSVGQSLFEFARTEAIKKIIRAKGYAPDEQRDDLVQRAWRELEAEGLAA